MSSWGAKFSQVASQNLTNLLNFKHAYPRHPGAVQKTSHLNNAYDSYQSIFLDLDNVQITQKTL